MVLVSLMLHFVILFSFCISHLFPHQRRCSNLANSPHNGFYWSTICRVLHTLSSFVPLFFISKSLTKERDNLDEYSTTPPFEHSCAVKNGHILPRGQWYTPSAVINDALIMPEYARVCESMPEYARVCQSMPEYARVCQSMREYARIWQSMPEYAIVSQGIQEFARVSQSIPEYVRVCQSMPEYAILC